MKGRKVYKVCERWRGETRDMKSPKVRGGHHLAAMAIAIRLAGHLRMSKHMIYTMSTLRTDKCVRSSWYDF